MYTASSGAESSPYPLSLVHGTGPIANVMTSQDFAILPLSRSNACGKHSTPPQVTLGCTRQNQKRSRVSFTPESEHEKWDDDGPFSIPSAKIINRSLEESIKEFLLDEVHNLFTELDRRDAFQAADSFRRQLIVPVEYLHNDGITIPEIDI
jgi:hypothetical protein